MVCWIIFFLLEHFVVVLFGEKYECKNHIGILTYFIGSSGSKMNHGKSYDEEKPAT